MDTFEKELNADFERRIDEWRAGLTAMTSKRQQLCATTLVKLSKSTKNMPIREFNSLYKCDLLSLIGEMGGSSEVNHPSKKRDRMDLSTPAAARHSNRNLQTPSRTVRRGEELFSKNGSPLEAVDDGALVATVVKKLRSDGVDPIVGTSFDINIGPGRFISLNDTQAFSKLDPEARTTTVETLAYLHDQVASLLQQLQK